VDFLRKEKLWGNDDPLFPATEVIHGPAQRFEIIGLARRHWSNATPIRTVFKDAFAQAGLPYFNPHGFRKTLAHLAYELRLGPEEFKVWSQNLGHETILTTLSSYGEVSPCRQAEIMHELASRRQPISNKKEIAQQIAELASQLQI
jgi:integrase